MTDSELLRMFAERLSDGPGGKVFKAKMEALAERVERGEKLEDLIPLPPTGGET